MIETKYDPALALRMHKVRGELTFEELHETLQGLYEAPDFRPEESVLWDIREADLTGFSPSQIRLIADLVQRNWGVSGGARAALVVSRDVDFGLARMYELQLSGELPGEVQVFRDVDEATAWITEGGTT